MNEANKRLSNGQLAPDQEKKFHDKIDQLYNFIWDTLLPGSDWSRVARCIDPRRLLVPFCSNWQSLRDDMILQKCINQNIQALNTNVWNVMLQNIFPTDHNALFQRLEFKIEYLIKGTPPGSPTRGARLVETASS